MNLTVFDLLAGWGISFMLILTRIAALTHSLPFFGSAAITSRLRVMIALSMSFFVLPLAGQEHLGHNWSLGVLVLHLARETSIGLVVGYGAKFLFESFTLAGTFAGRQMGFAMSNLIDPITSVPQSLIGQFWALVAILFFLALDGHHFLVRIMMENFNLVPLTTGSFSPATAQLLIDGSNNMFRLALRLAAPALIITMMLDVGMAVLSRAMPRFQIFFVTLPLKLIVGVFALVVSLQLFQALFVTIVADYEVFLIDILISLRGTGG